MKTIIFDIDGTITNMWPIERSVLRAMIGKKYCLDLDQDRRGELQNNYEIYQKISKNKITKSQYGQIYNRVFRNLAKNKKLPRPVKYPTVDWIIKNKGRYRFLYVTGGYFQETKYVLSRLGISQYFDWRNSLNKSNCRFSKESGVPFKVIKSKFDDCLLVTDSQKDCDGASLVDIPFLKIKPGQRLPKLIFQI